MKRRKSKRKIVIILILAVFAFLFSFFKDDITSFIQSIEPQESYALPEQEETSPTYQVDDIPAYQGNLYVVLNNNEPNFSETDYTTTSFEHYSDLDSLGRCGVAFANVGLETMPTEDRGSIGQVKPSGWHTVKYDNVSGNIYTIVVI